MATEVIMPQMGFDMHEGKLVRWIKREGDPVSRGEAIAEIETDKALVEVEAFASGVLRRILVAEGEVVPVGQIIGIIAAPEEALPEVAEVGPVAPAKEALSTAVAPPPPSIAPSREVRASPLARRIAEEQGIDLSLVTGTGPGGRITKEDVLAYAQQAAALAPPPPAAVVPEALAPAERPAPILSGLSPMRQAIARRMSQSKREIPHFYVTMEIDMTEAMSLRERLNTASEGAVRVSVNDLIVRACALGLRKFPSLNASLVDERLQTNATINIGIAVALEEGLIAPALLDCGNKSLVAIARAAKDLTERVRTGAALRPDENTGATFTVTNLGMYEVDNFIAIVNPPQAAILAVGAVRPQPMVREGQIVIRQIMKASVSADHRITDGAQAAQFLREVKGLLENPVSLLL